MRKNTDKQLTPIDNIFCPSCGKPCSRLPVVSPERQKFPESDFICYPCGIEYKSRVFKRHQAVFCQIEAQAIPEKVRVNAKGEILE